MVVVVAVGSCCCNVFVGVVACVSLLRFVCVVVALCVCVFLLLLCLSLIALLLIDVAVCGYRCLSMLLVVVECLAL